MGTCIVEPRAVATHLLAKGGVRAIKDRLQLEKADKILFNRRMSGDQWKKELFSCQKPQ